MRHIHIGGVRHLLINNNDVLVGLVSVETELRTNAVYAVLILDLIAAVERLACNAHEHGVFIAADSADQRRGRPGFVKRILAFCKVCHHKTALKVRWIKHISRVACVSHSQRRRNTERLKPRVAQRRFRHNQLNLISVFCYRGL